MDKIKEDIVSDIINQREKEGNKKSSFIRNQVKKDRVDYEASPVVNLHPDQRNEDVSDADPKKEGFKRKKILFTGISVYAVILLIVLGVVYQKPEILPKFLKDYVSKDLKGDKISSEEGVSVEGKKSGEITGLSSLKSQVKDLQVKNKETEESLLGMKGKNIKLLKQLVKEKTDLIKLNKKHLKTEKENKLLKDRMKSSLKSIAEFKTLRKSMSEKKVNTKELSELRNKNIKMNATITRLQGVVTSIVSEKESSLEKVAVNESRVNELTLALKASDDELKNTNIELKAAKKKMTKERAQMHYNLGYVFKEKKMYKDAALEYNKALKVMPNDPDTHYNLAIIYDDFINDNDLAVQSYKKYLELKPNSDDAATIKEWIEAAEIEG